MKIKLFFLVLMTILLQSIAEAKTLKPSSFNPSPFDLSGSINPVLDRNGIPCALIKITLPEGVMDISFEGNIVETIHEGNEIKAYFTAGTKKIVIKSPGYSPQIIIFSEHDVYRLLSKQVYNLHLQVTTREEMKAESIHSILDDPSDDPIDAIVAKANQLFSEGNPEAAAPLLQTAADSGHTEALLSLGLMYENGKGVAMDKSKGFNLVQKAAQQGYAPAQKTLSRYYLLGIGVQQDVTQGQNWKKQYENSLKSSDELIDESRIFTSVELMPEYPGGEKELYHNINKYLRYPVKAMEDGIEARVSCHFVITKDGSIGEINILKVSCYETIWETNEDGTSKGEKKLVDYTDSKIFEDASISAIRQLDKFYPGKMNGKPVNVWYILPINFHLQ